MANERYIIYTTAPCECCGKQGEYQIHIDQDEAKEDLCKPCYLNFYGEDEIDFEIP